MANTTAAQPLNGGSLTEKPSACKDVEAKPGKDFAHTTAAQPLNGGSLMDTISEPSACKDVEAKPGKDFAPEIAHDSKPVGPTDAIANGYSSKAESLSDNNLDESFLDDLDLSWLAPVKGEPKREAKFGVRCDPMSRTTSQTSSIDMLGGSQPSTISSQSSVGSQEQEPEEVTMVSNKRKADEIAQAPPLFDPARLFGSFEPPTTHQPAPASGKAPSPKPLPTAASFSNDATPKPSSGQPIRKAGKCHNCVQEGHWASECPFIKSKMLASRESKCALCPFVIKAQKDVIVKLGCGPFTYQWVHRACGMEHLVHLGKF